MHNVHERVLAAPVDALAPLIDGLASADDRLWPHDRWPRMRMDRPLGPGARGGHGPIGYEVTSHEPGRRVVFRFTHPRGFDGEHRFELEEEGPGRSRLRHVIDMRTRGAARWTWPLAIRPLHDALLEDALDRAECFAGGKPPGRAWPLRVRLLRRALRGRRRG